MRLMYFEVQLEPEHLQRNSFQIVIATSSSPSTETYVSMLYERVTAAAGGSYCLASAVDIFEGKIVKKVYILFIEL